MDLSQAFRNDLEAMPPGLVLGAVVILLVAGVVLGVLIRHHRHTALLRQFGPEYDSALEEYGSEEAADKSLLARKKRVQKLHVRSLNERQRVHVTKQWRDAQALFVDNPWGAVRYASTLIKSVLHEQGYPSEGFEQRVADLSVDHARVLDHYRAAHALSKGDPNDAGTTEELRQAMLHYRAIMEDLLEPTAQAAARWREVRAS